MQTADIAHCEKRIAEEVMLGMKAGSPEAGDRHFQIALLYRAQLATLERLAARITS